MRAAFVLVLATTGSVHAGNHELALGVSDRAMQTTSANALTGDSLTGGTLGYGHQLSITLAPGMQVWAVGHFAWGSADGRMFPNLTTELDTQAFTAGIRASYAFTQHIPGLRHAPIVRHIVATGRLELGTARAALAIRDDDGHTATDAGWGATSEAALGLELVAPGRSVSVGVRAELGYVGASRIPLVATQEVGDEDTLTLAMTAASLGSLDLSGPMFLISAVGQF